MSACSSAPSDAPSAPEAATTSAGSGATGDVTGTSSPSSSGASSGGSASGGAGEGVGGAAPKSGGTKLGVHVALPEGSTTDDEIAVTKALGARYTRTAITLSQWPNGKTGLPKYQKYVAAGLGVLLNLNWGPPNATPFPSGVELATYKKKLSAVLDALDAQHIPPELVVIENEEINPDFHAGPIEDYVAMLEAASPIVHAHGLKLSNGGVYMTGLYALVYRHLEEAHGQAAADAFGAVAFRPGTLQQVRNGSSLTVENAAATVQKVLDAAPVLDYVNVHHYEVDDKSVAEGDVASVTTATPGVLQAIADFVRHTTNKPILANETSTRGNTQPALVTSFLQDYVDNAYPYVIWWDNFDGNSYQGAPLNDDTSPFALRPNGQAFRDFVIANAADAAR
jgi:hypothetical protein